MQNNHQAPDRVEQLYMNNMQLQATIIDPKILIAEVGRGGGKTEFTGSRITRVAYSMPGETSYFIHKTYAALLTNIIPPLLAYFRTPRGEHRVNVLREGIDYVFGEKNLPDHFAPPRYPIGTPKHTLVFANGHNVRLVSSDNPDSAAGASGVHAFVEEMKHNKGQKLKSRIFPAMRGGMEYSRKSPYYEGITGVSDTARVDLGEDDWFFQFERLMDSDLIDEIANVAMRVNELLHNLHVRQVNVEKNTRLLNYWMPILNQMRKNATYYIRASSFVNHEVLGYNYFKTQLDALSEDEFLSSICNIRRKQVQDMFFAGWDAAVHEFDDTYNYHSIEDVDIREGFRVTASMLKHYNPSEPLVLGYDPGHFQSVIVAQEDRRNNTLRVIKDFHVHIPEEQAELARQIHEFFFLHAKSVHIKLFYDRAGNKTRAEQDKITSDARIFRRELEANGFRVQMKNENQRTIFYYEHFKLISMMLSEKFRSLPRLRVCSNEAKDLCSAIKLSPVKREDGKILLDKTSERKVPMAMQAGLTTQLPSALMYMLFGLYGDKLPGELRKSPDIAPNVVA